MALIGFHKFYIFSFIFLNDQTKQFKIFYIIFIQKILNKIVESYVRDKFITSNLKDNVKKKNNTIYIFNYYILL